MWENVWIKYLYVVLVIVVSVIGVFVVIVVIVVLVTRGVVVDCREARVVDVC